MTKSFFGIFILLTIVITSYSQTADEIIKKHLEARGGVDKMKSLQTLITHATLVQGGTDVELTFSFIHGKAYRSEFSAAGQTGYTIVTEKEGWTFNPFGGNSEAQPLTPEQLKEAQGQLDIHGPLMDYQAKGSTVEYLGKESEQGVEYYKLKLIRADGQAMFYYFNKDFLTAKTVTKATIQGAEQEILTTYSDYRKSPEGITFAYKRSSSGNEITFNKIEVNPKIPESVFKPGN